MAKPTPPAGLTFPDLPRMELDQLLRQLVERAHEVMSSQGRLRGLLAANQLIIADLALPAVLRHIAEAARELVGARYAALGVIAPAGGLAEFVHVGMADDVVERIGHLPEGKGLLGALIEDPRPIRAPDIARDARSSGFPPAHPPMSSFLGVPIRVRDEVFGNLYLTESTKGDFTAEDEELAKALAATAAVAIDNARLFEAAQSRGEWLQASAAITRDVASSDATDVVRHLTMIAERSLTVACAASVAVLLPSPDDETSLAVDVAVGVGAEVQLGGRLPITGTLAGQAFLTGESLRADSHGELDALTSSPGRQDPGPLLVVPLIGSRCARGVLVVARTSGHPGFTEEELEMASGFADHATVAIELAEARAEQQRAALLDDRERIAADLHDHVIQRLFAAGLSLQSVVGRVGEGRAAERIAVTIEDLDATISQIRTTIFQLQHAPRADDRSVRGRILTVISDVVPALGFQPSLRFQGPLEHAADDDIVEDLLAVLREALTNVARHARARSVEVDVTAALAVLTLRVQDDGIGVTSTRTSGLANMRRRAERHGGIFTVSRRDVGGTVLAWQVPTDRPGTPDQSPRNASEGS